MKYVNLNVSYIIIMIYLNSYTSFPVVVVNSVEYPPIPGMTTNSTPITTASYGNGTYVASASSELSASYRAFYAFDKTNPISLIGWIGKSAAYAASTGIYAASVRATTSVVNVGNVDGEFLQLQISTLIQITSYSITSGPEGSPSFNRTPRNWILVASIDGKTWIQIDVRADQSYTSANQTLSFAVTGASSYNYFRLIVQNIQPSNDGLCQIGELKLFSPTIFNEYPPQAMTTNSTSITTASYGNGTYTTSVSNDGGGLTFNAFNKANPQWMAWRTDVGLFPNTNGVYTGTAFSISGFGNGHWIRLTMPTAITLTSYSIAPMVTDTGTFYLRAPTAWKVLGSNNEGTTYSLVDTKTTPSFTSYTDIKTFTCNPSVAYSTYAFLISAIGVGNDGFLQVGELRFFGY